MRRANSRDHIFPAFLGGTRTVPACRECNSAFGSTFEGRIHRSVVPVQVMLGTNGFPLPKQDVAWREAYTDPEDGIAYDLFAGFRLRPSRISFVSRPDGGYRIIGGNKRTVRKVGQGFASSGGPQYPTEPTSQQRQVSLAQLQLKVKIPVDADMRRLAVKCCVALMSKFEFDRATAPEVRDWLTNPKSPTFPDIRAVFSAPQSVQRAYRPSHYIRVEGDPTTGHVTGLFRPFDLLSIFVRLADGFSGEAFAINGRLDMVDLSESFTNEPPIGLDLPPRRVLRWVMAYEQICALQRLDTFAAAIYGRARIKFAPSWLLASMLLRH